MTDVALIPQFAAAMPDGRVFVCVAPQSLTPEAADRLAEQLRAVAAQARGGLVTARSVPPQ